MLHARYVNGNLAFWDTHRNRIVDAVGATVVSYINHFTQVALDDTTLNPDEWNVTTDHNGVALPVSLTGGVLQIPCGDTDNDEYYMQLGGSTIATNAPWIIAGALGVANTRPLYFGARVKMMEIADLGCFVGLAEEGSAAADFLANNSAVVADKDFIGFSILTATPTAWNMTWRRNGEAVQTTAGVATNAADWHIFEFYYDGVTTVTFYIDGTAHATTATTTAGTFPYAEEMAPILGVKTGEAVLKRLQVDWLRVVQFN